MLRGMRGSARLALIAVLFLLTALLSSTPVQTGATVAPAWTSLLAANDGPLARSQFGMVIDDAGNLYVFGGDGPDGTPLADFWSWRVRDRTWRRLASNGMPPLIEPHLALDATGAIYEFGGIGAAGAANASADGHSFGLYRYDPRANRWADLTPLDAQPNVDWPVGREDHGFTYVPDDQALWVFAGEGQGNVSLADMWRFSLVTRVWTRVHPRFVGGSAIDAREIYAISYDGHGGLLLFGGAFLFGPGDRPTRWPYVNDLWRFDVRAERWKLLAGQANAYDPTMPLPRHYYGQACDAAGNFYVLGGFLSDVANTGGGPPYFADDRSTLYAQVVAFAGADQATGYIFYAVDDFWRFDARRSAWLDLSDSLGALGAAPFIPYVMVHDPTTNTLLTFGGYHTGDDGLLHQSSSVWSYLLPPASPTPVTAQAGVPQAAIPSPTAAS